MDMDESIIFVRKNRGLAIAIGSVYSVMILVPVDLGAFFDWSNLPNDRGPKNPALNNAVLIISGFKRVSTTQSLKKGCS